MNGSAQRMPEIAGRRGKIHLERPISAIQLLEDESGHETLGLLSQLGPGTRLERCGKGFSKATVKVRANGHYFFVFAEDLEL